MSIIGTYYKQPGDRLDYDIDYSEWLTDGDSLVSALVEITPVETSGLTVDDSSGGTAGTQASISGERVKLWVNAGIDGHTYKVTVTTTTDQGRVKQDEVRFKVKDY